MVAAASYAAAFVITMALNVPLNEQLAVAGPVERLADPSAVRVAFEAAWVRWNILRTVASTAALAALAVALLRVSPDPPLILRVAARLKDQMPSEQERCRLLRPTRPCREGI